MPRDKGEEPAFPTKLKLSIPSLYDSGSVPKEVEFVGITIRDYFAAKALCGLIAQSDMAMPCSTFAEEAYKCADAMLSAREVPDAPK